MWSQRLPESLQSSCEHCHKNRVPWTGCHCSEGCALCTGSPGTTYGNSVKHHLPHPRDVLLGAHFRGNVSDGKDGAAESREVTGQPPQPLVPGCGFATLELPQPWTPPAVSVSVADLHSNNSLGAPFSQASEPGIPPPAPMQGQGNPSCAVPLVSPGCCFSYSRGFSSCDNQAGKGLWGGEGILLCSFLGFVFSTAA